MKYTHYMDTVARVTDEHLVPSYMSLLHLLPLLLTSKQLRNKTNAYPAIARYIARALGMRGARPVKLLDQEAAEWAVLGAAQNAASALSDRLMAIDRGGYLNDLVETMRATFGERAQRTESRRQAVYTNAGLSFARVFLQLAELLRAEACAAVEVHKQCVQAAEDLLKRELLDKFAIELGELPHPTKENASWIQAEELMRDAEDSFDRDLADIDEGPAEDDMEVVTEEDTQKEADLKALDAELEEAKAARDTKDRLASLQEDCVFQRLVAALRRPPECAALLGGLRAVMAIGREQRAECREQISTWRSAGGDFVTCGRRRDAASKTDLVARRTVRLRESQLKKREARLASLKKALLAAETLLDARSKYNQLSNGLESDADGLANSTHEEARDVPAKLLCAERALTHAKQTLGYLVNIDSVFVTFGRSFPNWYRVAHAQGLLGRPSPEAKRF